MPSSSESVLVARLAVGVVGVEEDSELEESVIDFLGFFFFLNRPDHWEGDEDFHSSCPTVS